MVPEYTVVFSFHSCQLCLNLWGLQHDGTQFCCSSTQHCLCIGYASTCRFSCFPTYIVYSAKIPPALLLFADQGEVLRDNHLTFHRKTNTLDIFKSQGTVARSSQIGPGVLDRDQWYSATPQTKPIVSWISFWLILLVQQNLLIISRGMRDQFLCCKGKNFCSYL